MSLVSGTNYNVEIIGGPRNILINGRLNFWQRGTTFTNTITEMYELLADRWVGYKWATTGRVTQSRSTDVPTQAQCGVELDYSWKMDVDTAETLTTAGSAVFSYNMEGFDFSFIKEKTCTLSFWIKTNQTGKYSVAFRNGATNTRSWATSITINAAATWEKKTVTVPFTEATGTWATGTANAMRMEIVFDAGSNLDITTNETWQTGGVIKSTDHNIAFLSNIANYVNVALLQLEVGDTATEFEYKSYADELARCQRYYFASDTTQNTGAVARANSTIACFGAYIFLPSSMRDAPTIATSSASMLGGTIGTLLTDNITNESFRAYSANSSGMTAGEAISLSFDYTADAEF